MNSADALRVMSFNLRVDTPNDGINCFMNRSSRVLEMIRREAPDLIGFQEVKNGTRAFLREQLPQYVVLGCGRNVDYDGEGILIAYREDQFELIEFQTKWLSDTPDLPGSRFDSDQSKYPRVYVYAKLRRFGDNKTVAFVNTHTDHVGQKARVSASKQLLKAMHAMQADALVLTGDFNARPDSEEMRMIIADTELGLTDASAMIPATFHNFGRCVPWKYDYIFSTRPSSECHVIEDVPVNGVYLSDHNPIVSTILMS